MLQHTFDPDACTTDPTAENCDGSNNVYTHWTDREYVYHPNGDVNEYILQIDKYDVPVYVVQDGNLNVVALVDASGAVLRQYSYSPYGELLETESFGTHADNHIGFQGMTFDRIAAPGNSPTMVTGVDGLYLTSNRSYSPTLGRFLERDPNATAISILEFAASMGQTLGTSNLAFELDTLYGDGLSLYLFATSNPITGRDPLGLFGLGDTMTTVGIQGLAQGLISGAINRALGGSFTEGLISGAIGGAIGGAAGSLVNRAFAASAAGLWGTLAANSAVGAADGGLGAFAQSYYSSGDLASALIDGVFGAAIGAATGGLVDWVVRGARTAIGFSSFAKLKQFLGPAGPNRQWHHIVEQSKIGQFGAEAIHNVDNVVSVPTTVNLRINGHYSSKQPFTGGKTVRQWLSGKSFEEQRAYGLKILRTLGGE